MMSLPQVIAAQIDCAEQLLETLEAERLALVEQDIDRLGGICARKLDQCRQLQRLGDSLQHLQPVRHGFGPDRTSWPDIASPAAPSGDDWTRLRQLAVRCDQANRFNGALVDAHESRLRTTLAALHPQSQSPSVYGRRGAAVRPVVARLHDRA